MALFAATLLHSGTNAHFAHWSTNSYSEHVALGEYYDEIIDLVDALVEAYMGCYTQLKDFPEVYHKPKGDTVSYFVSLQRFVKEARQDLPKETQIVQLIDNIAELIDTTIYKLKNLK